MAYNSNVQVVLLYGNMQVLLLYAIIPSVLVSLIFGSAIPTSFNVLMKMFLHLFTSFSLYVSSYIDINA